MLFVSLYVSYVVVSSMSSLMFVTYVRHLCSSLMSSCVVCFVWCRCLCRWGLLKGFKFYVVVSLCLLFRLGFGCVCVIICLQTKERHKQKESYWVGGFVLYVTLRNLRRYVVCVDVCRCFMFSYMSFFRCFHLCCLCHLCHLCRYVLLYYVFKPPTSTPIKSIP